MRAWIESDDDEFAVVDDVGFTLASFEDTDDNVIKWAGITGWSGEGGTMRARAYLLDCAQNEIELEIDITECGL